MTDQSSQINTDIAIAGGGPTGLAMACALSGCGLRVLLVDAGKDIITCDELVEQAALPAFDARVSALTVTSQQFLQALGVWDLIRTARVCPYQDMHVWDGEGTGSIHFSAADIHAPNLGHIVENQLVSAVLMQQARLSPDLQVIQEDKVNSLDLAAPVSRHDSAVMLVLDSGTRVRTRLLIGADGANSFVREESGFRLRQWEYGHKAIVTTVKTEKPHDYTARQRFMHTGPLAFLPLHLPGRRPEEQCYSSIVWSCVTERADGILALDEDAFMAQLAKAFEYRLGRIEQADKRYSFPLSQRHATDYVQDHLALVGDAAHTIHPLAGQGVNLGFADVQVLADVIRSAHARGENFACHQVLSRYQRKRKGPNLGMMAAMEGFRHVFASHDLVLTWLRNTGLNLTDNLPLLKQQLMRQAMGL